MEEGYTNYTLRMKKEERDEWKQAVENSDQFSSLSQLIRYATKQEMRRIEDRQEGGMSKEEREVIDKIKAQHGRTRDALDDIKEIVEHLDGIVLTTSESEAITHKQTQTLIQHFEQEDE